MCWYKNNVMDGIIFLHSILFLCLLHRRLGAVGVSEEPQARDVDKHHALEDPPLSPRPGHDEAGPVPARAPEPDRVAGQGVRHQRPRRLHHGDVVLCRQAYTAPQYNVVYNHVQSIFVYFLEGEEGTPTGKPTSAKSNIEIFLLTYYSNAY